MMRPIPAPGFRRISGKRNPPTTDSGYWVQLGSGWVDELGPWPVRGPNWKWKAPDEGPAPWEVAAVKKA